MASVATKIFQELVEGVFYIHNMGIVHRDLKVSQTTTPVSTAMVSHGVTRCEFMEYNEVMYPHPSV